MEGDDDLDLLTSLLEESEAEEDSSEKERAAGHQDEYDLLFEAEDDASYIEGVEEEEEERSTASQENVAELFGDVTDLLEEEKKEKHVQKTSRPVAPDRVKEPSKEDLQDELRKLKEQMKKLQEQLGRTGIGQPPEPDLCKKTPGQSNGAVIKERTPSKVQKSPSFSAQQINPALPLPKSPFQKSKSMIAVNKNHTSKATPSLLSQPLTSVPGNRPTADSSKKIPVTKNSEVKNQNVSMEIYSGLKLRKPRVSSAEMERKMTGRKLIRLSQVQDKLRSANLEEMDWVTFGVIIKKMTPQSSNNGKTFSIWHLNDLRDFNRSVSLFLFGDVHKEHWKTDQGMVVGLLNANQMKPKEGSEEVCLSVDHPQKILILGEAMDLGTCKSRKKNGEPCTQMVNQSECEYCHYHIQSEYRKRSSKRADLQSTFSTTRAPKRTAKRNLGLKEKLCQDGFYYGGVSSSAYAASVAAAAVPKRKVQTTLTNLVVRGVDAILQETKEKLGLAKPPCSEEFQELLAVPSAGARNLNRHFTRRGALGTKSMILTIPWLGLEVPSNSVILFYLPRDAKTRANASWRLSPSAKTIILIFILRCRFLQDPAVKKTPAPSSSVGQAGLKSPTPAAEFPKAGQLSSPQTPRLGSGLSEGDDVLFFDDCPPLAPKLNCLAEAKKMAAIKKLHAKGQILPKVDPNSIKRKRSDFDVPSISERVEKNIADSEEGRALEPVEKKRRQQLEYLESAEFQEILNARSKHNGVLKEFEAEMQERYFEPLVKKEQMEEKMRNIREVKCRVATCKTCNYTYFKLLDSCVAEGHAYHWHNGVKRFFKCACGNRAISLDKLPKKHCSNCGLYKWERDGMLKEKKGPKIGAETLLPRGEEHAQFLNSMK
ncbi:protein MCM10 homolog [Notechis scutatus]|uniref:Protein MCM10 homolog n=1 Tax=Notechis scutatus TaxID=8663 RepID=A0A6J1VZK1_9SAUR|nr:protein MCM10 homolog [Notechis scutatus]